MITRNTLLLIALVLLDFTRTIALSSPTNMVWDQLWDDILDGGDKRWKVDGLEEKKIAYNHICRHSNTNDESVSIFCPLAGDDPFVKYAFDQGHTVTALDLVPAATAALRSQFSGEWTSEKLESGHTLYRHESGRAFVYQGDALQSIPALHGSFDVVYDKDAFGALQPSMRASYAARLSEYTKPNAIFYTEVKNKDDNRSQGPPFHVEKEDLLESFGETFEHVEALGPVYDSGMPGFLQIGHVLKRVVNEN